jgi:hypothetical protein
VKVVMHAFADLLAPGLDAGGLMKANKNAI